VAERNCVLVTPISPQQEGNGLAHRCRAWQDVLAQLGRVTTLLVPVSGPPKDGDLVVGPTLPTADDALPHRARQAPEALGRAARADLDGTPDLVLALRADLGLVALGLAAGTDAFVAVDLNDDDVTFARSRGDEADAARYATLIGRLRERVDLLVSVTGFDGTAAVPNCMDRHWADGPSEALEPALLMVGNFIYEPNVRGARWFLDEVLPLVHAARPDAVVHLVGRGSEVFGPYGHGFVVDLQPLYSAAAVAVVPLLEGSGSRIKALEAFAAGVPVVGTTVGLSGLPVRPGVDCVVADEPAEMAAAIVRLLDDPDHSEQLVVQAGQLVKRFDRPVVVAEAAALLEQALAEPRERRYRRAPGLIETQEPDGLVVIDDAGTAAHHLNELAASVFLLADGWRSESAIVDELASLTGAAADDLRPLVAATVSDLAGAGLLLAGQGQQAG
jgi:hypothetical protein